MTTFITASHSSTVLARSKKSDPKVAQFHSHVIATMAVTNGSDPVPPRITSNVKQNLQFLKLWKEYNKQKSSAPKPMTSYRRKKASKEELPDNTDLYQDPTTSLYYTNQGLETAVPVLLVDGYNVCGYWPKLKKHFMSGRLDVARQKLIDELVSFSVLKEVKVVVVFDAMMSGMSTHKEHFAGREPIVYLQVGCIVSDFSYVSISSFCWLDRCFPLFFFLRGRGPDPAYVEGMIRSSSGVRGQVKATYERLKFLRPPCKSCYKSHFEPTMVAKFLAGLSPEYAAAKDQMLTGSEIPDLSDAYNKLSRLAISLSQPAGVTPASALAVGSGRGHGSTYSTRGRGIGRGTGGRGRFQCTYCGKIGHLEDRCWDKHGRPSSLSQGRNMVTKQGKSSTYSSMGSAQTATPTVEDSSPSIAPETVSIDRVEAVKFRHYSSTRSSLLTVHPFTIHCSSPDTVHPFTVHRLLFIARRTRLLPHTPSPTIVRRRRLCLCRRLSFRPSLPVLRLAPPPGLPPVATVFVSIFSCAAGQSASASAARRLCLSRPSPLPQPSSPLPQPAPPPVASASASAARLCLSLCLSRPSPLSHPTSVPPDVCLIDVASALLRRASVLIPATYSGDLIPATGFRRPGLFFSLLLVFCPLCRTS
ncbi:hypothetical protein EJ110_NYTH56920 [Nymphaea thermarum]|nr:hypothetical protein EJ110_NYTH56920 [Nymphaea thermarum]